MVENKTKSDSEKTIDDFLIPHFCLPTNELDYQAIMALNDVDFGRIYLALMNEYRDKDGWWGTGKTPSCWECHEIIPGPEQLRRYKGASLHAECFPKHYEKENISRDGKLMDAYWRRVIHLDLTKLNSK